MNDCRFGVSPVNYPDPEPGIENLLKDISMSKAIGPDKISNFILKNCASQLGPGLAIIYQVSSDSGSLPSDWVNANKKGDVH